MLIQAQRHHLHRSSHGATVSTNNLNRTLTWKIREAVSSLEQTYEESLIIMNRVQYKFLARLIDNTTLKKLQKVGIIITMLSSIIHHWTYLPTYLPTLFDISRTTIIFPASNLHTARAWLRGCQYIITTRPPTASIGDAGINDLFRWNNVQSRAQAV